MCYDKCDGNHKAPACSDEECWHGHDAVGYSTLKQFDLTFKDLEYLRELVLFGTGFRLSSGHDTLTFGEKRDLALKLRRLSDNL